MKSTNSQIIREMLEDFQNEYNKITDQINSNSLKIQEADCYVNSILGKEESDYKFFSPRDAGTLYKNEITHINNNRNQYEEENEELYLKRDYLASKIQQLKKILSEELEQGYITLNIQEKERQRIARDLHDTSLQNLAHLVHKIELSSMYIDKDPLNAKLELAVVSKKLKLVIEEIRNTIFNLRPMSFDDLGMKAALERLLSVINENKEYEIDVDIDDVSCENNLLLVSIYRIIHEFLNNIVKHAEATKIYLHCKLINDNYCVVIKDNGKGFSPESIEHLEGKHFGISLIHERIELIGGSIKMQSNTEGTIIEMKIPIK